MMHLTFAKRCLRIEILTNMKMALLTLNFISNLNSVVLLAIGH